MSAIDLVLLGILTEGPKSAYEIQKDVDAHHFSRWAEISVPSVYRKLPQLRAKGFLDSQQVQGERAEKAVYSITEAGQAELRRLLLLQAQQAVPLRFAFNGMISNLNKVSRPEALELLDHFRASLQASAQASQDYARTYPDLPLVGRTIFHQQQRLYEALLQWLEEFQAQFAAGEP